MLPSSWSRGHESGRLAVGFGALVLAACSLPTEGTGPTRPWYEGEPELSATTEDASTYVQPDAPLLQDAGSTPLSDLRDADPSAPDARIETSSDDSGFAADTSFEPSSQCRSEGLFAVRADMEVDWDSTDFIGIPVLQTGAGKIAIVVLMEWARTPGGELTGTVRQCHTSVPPFEASLLGERYSVVFPDELWNARGMPQWDLRLGASCTEPGCQLRAEPLDALLGIELSDPAGPWPESGLTTGISFPDHDNDGSPGITLITRGPPDVDVDGAAFSYPPLSLLARASEIMFAVRVHTLFEAQLNGCDHLTGQTYGTRIDTRAVGCTNRTQAGDVPCDALQTAFVDANVPTWQVTSTEWNGVRMPAGATCQMARDALL